MSGNGWQAGLGRTVITPARDVALAGYYFERRSTGAHDDLHARALAVGHGAETVALVAVEWIQLTAEIAAAVRETVRRECGLPADHVLLSATHTHTGPLLAREPEYVAWAVPRIAGAVRAAVADMRPARLLAGRAEERSVSFIRRYRMKDGSIRTNPGIGNPDAVSPIGEIDPEVLTLRVETEGRTRALLVNFALHCDTIGGTEIAADWPFFMAERLKQAGVGGEPFFFQGCCGDINHWNVFGGGHRRGFAEGDRIGAIVAAAAQRALAAEEEIAPGPVAGARRELEIPVVRVGEEEYAEAKALVSTPYESEADFTMERVLALKRVRAYEERSAARRTEVQALRMGQAAVVGLPGEMFNALGRGIKRASPFAATMVGELANDLVGYVGEHQNYAEGGYETTSAVYDAGSGELLRDAAIAALRRLA